MSLVKTGWFDDLVVDCRTLIDVAKLDAGMVLIEAKYALGKRILLDYERFGSYRGGKTQQDLADELGFSQQTLSDAIRFAEKIKLEYDDSFEGFTNTVGKPSWRKIVLEWLPARRKRFDPIDTPALPLGLFNVIYADPPWQYQFTVTYSREVEKNYPTMTLDEICALEVPSSEDAILFLWATSPKLEEAMRVLTEWGFEYRTSMAWIKDRIGMGHYVRAQHELILIGRKGEMRTPEESDRPSSVIMSPRREHSQKPDEVYDLIERMYPTGTYLELFSRGDRLGWTMWEK